MKRKNAAAVALGRKGGMKGGPARAASLTPEQTQPERPKRCDGSLGQSQDENSFSHQEGRRYKYQQGINRSEAAEQDDFKQCYRRIQQRSC
jgi:hypothetical protein